jgi:excisionase family DNA binding protein
MEGRANSSRTDQGTSTKVSDQLLTVIEAAQFLNIAPGSLYHMISQKRVPVIKLSARCVRFSRIALLSWLDGLTERVQAVPRISSRIGDRKP